MIDRITDAVAGPVGGFTRVLGTAWRILAFVFAALICLVMLARVFLGFSYQTVLTGSMRPEYPPGTVLVTREIPVTELKVGQVAVFVPPGHADPVSHRIIAITGSPTSPSVKTKGDANDAPDAWTSHLMAAKVPVVVTSVPWVGKVLSKIHLRNPATEALLVGGFGLLVTGSYVRRLTRHNREAVAPRHSSPADSEAGPARDILPTGRHRR